MNKVILAGALSVLATGALADHYMRTADPQIVQAVNEIIYALGEGCNAGNMTACNAIPQAQQHAHIMLSAGYDCQMQNNPAACQFYQQNIYMLQNVYQHVAAAAQSGALYQPLQAPGGGGIGATHEERMAQIDRWGQSRLDYGRESQAALDRSHDWFMSTQF